MTTLGFNSMSCGLTPQRSPIFRRPFFDDYEITQNHQPFAKSEPKR